MKEVAIAKNRVAMLKTFGGAESIEVLTVDIPSPSRNQVLIQVESSSLVFTDLLIRRKMYPMLRKKPPFVLGYSFVGHVIAVGLGVTTVQPGERVADLTQTGSNADYVLRSPDTLVRVPKTLDAAEAETLVLSGMTAFQALTRYRKMERGQRVLITGAAGAVGHLAGQLCTEMGLTWYGTCSMSQRPAIESSGGTPIVYDSQEGTAQLELESKTGFDLILDLSGADPPRTSRRRLREGGVLVLLGMRALWHRDAADRNTHLRDKLSILKHFFTGMLLKVRQPRTVAIYSIADRKREKPGEFREDLSSLYRILEAGKLKPKIAERIELEEIRRGHERLEREKLQGRLVIVHAKHNSQVHAPGQDH